MEKLRSLVAWFGRVRECGGVAAIEVDPFDHPAIRRMGPRELADLPFPRWRATVQCR